ncbi:hypothetical protein AVEN_39248-1 [Araneus ventricosus]|uniref:Uncharacterized protein n=1 Tax=Araneus ventricosus TaxID=182803 RepID=A0A4Y2EU68_ARAVE|nr:hypothetical protein AVEN_39248-1 [Araneus ventricosus]
MRSSSQLRPPRTCFLRYYRSNIFCHNTGPAQAGLQVGDIVSTCVRNISFCSYGGLSYRPHSPDRDAVDHGWSTVERYVARYAIPSRPDFFVHTGEQDFFNTLIVMIFAVCYNIPDSGKSMSPGPGPWDQQQRT